MSKKFKMALLCFFAVLVTAVASFILPFLSTFFPQSINKLKMVGARENVSSYDIESGKIVSLTGEWEFYWDKLLISEPESTPSEPDLFVSVPSSWTTYKIGDEKLSNGGVASYRTVITGINATSPIVVTVPDLAGAYRAYINGQLVSTNFDFSDSIRGAQSQVEIYTDPVTLQKGESCEIVIEVSCEYSSGITALPQLATFRSAEANKMQSVSVRFFFAGIVVFFTVMTSVFAFTLQDKNRLIWLILLCLTFGFRILICNEGFQVTHILFGEASSEIFATFVYASTYIIKLALFMHVVRMLKIYIPQYLLVAFSVLFLTCAIVPYAVYSKIYIANSFMWLQGASAVLDVYMIYRLSQERMKRTPFALVYLGGYCVTVAALFVDNFYYNGYIAGSVSYIMPLSIVLFITLTIFIMVYKNRQVEKQARKATELSKELAELNNTLMLSQIQPHFIFNALNTIKYLTKSNPKAAETAIVRFSSYLRSNMDSLTQKEPISIKEEIAHVQNYTEIEKLRFGERLRVAFDIQADDFSVPALTVQPLVENAIKHGVNQKPEGGMVTVSTYEDNNYYYITVRDDGIGFDVNEVKNDGRSHVGLSNIKTRLKSSISAEILVKSVIGEGTDIKIIIPKSNERK